MTKRNKSKMNVYFYVGMDLKKILSRRSHEPICALDISDYKAAISLLLNHANKFPILERLTTRFTDKVEFKNDELSMLAEEIEKYSNFNELRVQERDLFNWLVISIECAINHKKNIFVTGQSKI